MNFAEYLFLVKSDLFRYTEKVNRRLFFHHMRITPGFKFTFWMRTCHFITRIGFARFILLPICKWFYWHYTYKYSISIPYTTSIGPGFYIGHFGGIIVNQNCVIGKNCNISHGVTLGQTNRGEKRGCPVIGNNVYIGPGAVIIGKVVIGNNVAVGANCVATKDIPDNCVVVGVPGKIINTTEGSTGYINHTNYEVA